MKNKEIKILGFISLVVFGLISLAALFYKNSNSDEKTHSDVKVIMDFNAQLNRDGAHSLGPAVSRVQIVEFLDPECESCAAMHPIVKQILKEYPQVKLTVRYMPFHGNSVFAASLLEAAATQGQYWQLMEALFQYQHVWASHHDPRPEKTFEIAKQMGMAPEILRKIVEQKKEEYASIVERDRQSGMALGVVGTPTFFINGKKLQSLGYVPLKDAIEAELGK